MFRRIALTCAHFVLLATCLAPAGFGQSVSFGPPHALQQNVLPFRIVIADVNGDGIPDIVLPETRSSKSYLCAMLGKGDGTFQDRICRRITNSCPDTLALADLNHDGHLDAIVGDDCLGRVWIYMGDGDGTFGHEHFAFSGNEPFAILPLDLNGDGNPDLAIANGNNDTVSILLGNGDGTFQPRTTYPVSNSPFDMVAADVNEDGKMDLITANYSFGTEGTIAVLLGNGDGTFGAASYYPAGRHPYGLATADFNGDGHADLAVIDYTIHAVQILQGKGDGTFKISETLQVGNNPFKVIAADFNGDGIPDLATTNWADNTISVLLGNGTGGFATQVTFPAGGNGPEYFAAGDLNGDGKPDFVVPVYLGGLVTEIFNTTPGP